MEIKALEREILFKPFGLLTPILLAVGVYLLIQAPNQRVQDRNQCLREIEFVGQLEIKDSLPTIGALRQFPFICQSARAMFDSFVNLENSSTSLEDANSELQKVAKQLPVSDSNNKNVTICLRRVRKTFEIRRANLVEQLSTLVDRRTKLEEDQLNASMEADDALAGLDGTGVAGCGRICRSAQRRAKDLASRTEQLVIQISELRELISDVRSEENSALAICEPVNR